MGYELTKREMKICEICIDKALFAELRVGLESFEAIIREWRSGKYPDDRHAYTTLFTAVKESEKNIFSRYNNGRRLDPLMLVVVGYRNGYINDEDLKELSEEGKKKIVALSKRKLS